MEVDHILPESLMEESDQLAKVLKDFGLPKTFNLNAFENWLPSCHRCNNLKRRRVFVASPIIQVYLQIAREKAPAVRAAIAQVVSEKKLLDALNVIDRAIEGKFITGSQLAKLEDIISAAKAPRKPRAPRSAPRTGVDEQASSWITVDKWERAMPSDSPGSYRALVKTLKLIRNYKFRDGSLILSVKPNFD